MFAELHSVVLCLLGAYIPIINHTTFSNSDYALTEFSLSGKMSA